MPFILSFIQFALIEAEIKPDENALKTLHTCQTRRIQYAKNTPNTRGGAKKKETKIIIKTKTNFIPEDTVRFCPGAFSSSLLEENTDSKHTSKLLFQ